MYYIQKLSIYYIYYHISKVYVLYKCCLICYIYVQNYKEKKKKKLIISHKSYDQQQSICPPTKHVQKSNVINNVFKVILFYLSFIFFFLLFGCFSIFCLLLEKERDCFKFDMHVQKLSKT